MSQQSELLAYNGPVQVFGMTVNILALLGSSLVVLTGVIFSKEMTNKKIFMKLILFVSLCDIMTDIPGIFGFVRNNGPLCVTQAVTMHFFALASWLWCTMISLSLYSQMKYGTVYVHKGYVYMFFGGSYVLIWLRLIYVLPLSGLLQSLDLALSYYIQFYVPFIHGTSIILIKTSIPYHTIYISYIL